MPGIILSFSERAADKKTKSQPIWNLCFDKHFQCLDSSTSENSIIQITFCNALRMFLFYKHKHSHLNKKLRIAIFRTFLHIKIIAFSNRLFYEWLQLAAQIPWMLKIRMKIIPQQVTCVWPAFGHTIPAMLYWHLNYLSSLWSALLSIT